MRVIARRTLVEFAATRVGRRDHAALTHALDAWFHVVRRATWHSAADVRQSFAHANIVSANRIVFNIKGNDYRLVVAMHYNRQIAYIRFVGTHRQYDQIDATLV